MISSILLAAGQSTRMDGENKLIKEVDGVPIINYAIKNILGSSVVAQDCITADAYATSFMAMPLEKSVELISSLENIDVMIVYYDKNNDVKVYKTKGFERLILN